VDVRPSQSGLMIITNGAVPRRVRRRFSGRLARPGDAAPPRLRGVRWRVAGVAATARYAGVDARAAGG
jgi:hypothetical protein